MEDKETLSPLEAQYGEARENIEQADAFMRENIKKVNEIRPILAKEWLEKKYPGVNFTVSAKDAISERGHYNMNVDITFRLKDSDVPIDSRKWCKI